MSEKIRTPDDFIADMGYRLMWAGAILGSDLTDKQLDEVIKEINIMFNEDQKKKMLHYIEMLIFYLERFANKISSGRGGKA